MFYYLYDLYNKNIYDNIKKDETTNYIPFMLFFISVVIFTLIYKYICPKHFKHFNNEKMTLFNAFYFSTVNQTLLGSGDFLPLTTTPKIFIILQVFVTMFITLIASW